MSKHNEFLIILDPSSEETAGDMLSIASAHLNNRPAFGNVIAVYSDDDFQKIIHDTQTLLPGRKFLISETTGNTFGQGNF